MDTDIKWELSLFGPSLYNTTIDDNIKIENGVGDIKVKFNNKQLYCNNCNEHYKDYCTECGMLISILNGTGLNNAERKEIPTDVLEIKQGLFEDTGVFALRTIPKGVKFGPFTGFSTAESPWGLKGGKLIVSNDKSEFLNWMQYVNGARSVCDQNLHAFQYEDDLYYSSVCEIQEGEELLVYFGEEFEESLNNGVEMNFIPHVERDAKNVFACTYCCLGFSLKEYLAEHKAVCPYGTNGSFEKLAQCPFCKIYLEKNEYLEYHEIYCRKGSAKLCVLPALDDRILEEKSLSPVTNKCKTCKLTQCKYRGDPKNHTESNYEAKIFRCGICYKRFKEKEFLKLHVENIHINEITLNSHHKNRQFECLKSKFQTNNKHHLKSSHVKAKDLKDYDYYCMECEYKTNKQLNLEIHIKSKHL